MNDKQTSQKFHNHIQTQTDKIYQFNQNQKNYLQFQKNYPKNIFIPIIEYLAGLGFKEHYQRCVGTREQFEGKNVVSLSLIHQLLTQEWFQRNVNKRLLEANISNKILMNSKIKKKLFHLKVTKILLNISSQDPKIYKKNVSHHANQIAQNLQQNDQLFQYPSSIIYLLNLFLTSLKILFKQNTPLLSIQDDDNQPSTQSRQLNSKQQIKSLIKLIIHLFNHIQCSTQSLQLIEQKIKKIIQYRQHQINKKYQFNQNIPFWQDFYSTVITKCFYFKIQSQKITNTLFNQWLLDFKNKSNHLGLNTIHTLHHQPLLKIFIPTILIHPPRE